ncbi:carbonic anhydrase family protein [Sandaracinobacter sp.]|jgi:carbonic anhydrase|uniref:carbonic anhydrase family protein n=1 Tax=Sandaracinobacter sp. TaxID=2487581 RepID=UPI0035B0A8A2
MHDDHEHGEGCGCGLNRRAALMGLTLAGALAATATPASAQVLTQEMRDRLTPQQIIDLILKGNARFVAGTPQRRDWLAEQKGTAGGQNPAAVFLSCVDSRAPVEVICDFGIGQAFNARVAGNAVTDDILGSMEFATAAAGAKVAMVMGHTACGAIKGAIDNVRLGNLTLLLARFHNAVADTRYDGDRTSKYPAFVDAVAETHVRQSLQLIRDRSAVMRGLEAEGKIVIVGAMYDLETGRVRLI